MKQIRFLMEIFDYAGKPQAWKIPEYQIYNCQNSQFKNLDSYTLNDVNDTGFGSRLFLWQHGYLMGRSLGWKYRIVFEESQYPENIFLKFPRTYFINKEKFFTGIGHFQHINDELFDQILYRQIDVNKLGDYLFSNCAPQGADTFCYGKDPLSLIRLHYDGLRIDLENLCKKYVGVHVRRYYGVNYTDEDLEHLLPQYRKEYKEDVPYKNTSETWRYLQDDLYLSQMKKYSHDTMFYISTDLPDKYYLKYWKSILPGRVVTRRDILNEAKEIFVRYYGDEILKNSRKYNIFYQMLDWFVLLYCREILILRPASAPCISAYSDSALRIGSAKANIVIV